MKKYILIVSLLNLGFMSFLSAQSEIDRCGYKPDVSFLNSCQDSASPLNRLLDFLSQFSAEEVGSMTRLVYNDGTYSIKETTKNNDRNGRRRIVKPLQRSIPIVAHIVRRTDKSGGLSKANLDKAIADLNGFYNKINLSFFIYKINYIDADSLFNYSFSSDKPFTDEYGKLGMKTRSINRKMNIYFVPNSDTSWAPSPSQNKFQQHIILKNSHVSNGTTLSHEIGHWFNLLHTHGKSNNSSPSTVLTKELVDGSNCRTEGDFVCDTPADPGLSGRVAVDCQYNGNARLKDVNGATFKPDAKNIMSYAPKACRKYFSAGQYQRIQAAFLGMEFERGYTFSSTSTSNLDVVYEVPFIPQNTRVACWDASISMIIAWRDKYVYSPATETQAVDYWNQYYCTNEQSGGGLSAYNAASFRNFGMTTEIPMSRTPQNVALLLEDFGPLWVAAKTCLTENEDCLASKVITGIIGDGSITGTKILLTNPNARTEKDRTSTMSFQAFQAEMDNLQMEGLENGLEAYIAHLMTKIQ